MNKRIRIYPYTQGSRSAKALAEALGGKVLKIKNSTFVEREGDLIINWGAFNSPWRGRQTLNQPESIQTAGNKLSCLVALSGAGVRVPEFWTSRETIPIGRLPIVCRTLLTASEGRGIIIASQWNELVDAPLYTKYILKKEEYRIHVCDSSIISVQRKAKRHEADNADYMVRNLKNGFVFVREGVCPPEDVKVQALAAVAAVGLTFGAVDVIWNEHSGMAYVLEINCAPGLEGQTVTDYATALKDKAQ